MESRYTPQEALDVVTEALNLIRDPECFATGTWKCEIFTEDYKTGKVEQKKDAQGRPVYAYCIEGAINQATINLLGQARAIELGALTHKTGGEEPLNDDMDLSGATDELSLNLLAEKLFHDLTVDRGPTPAAQHVNDHPGDKEVAHQRVLRILRAKRDQLRRSLGVAA